MTYYDIEQNSDEWYALRKGKFTASTFKDLFSKPSTITYEKAIYKPVYERITGESPDSFYNEHMQRGHELEDSARMEYELKNDVVVTNGGFVELDEWIGCSPDGFVGNDGLIEIKCPAFNTHMNYLQKGKLPTIYKWQVHGQIWITNRKWCDFISYHPGLPTLIIRVERDEKLIQELETILNVSIEEAKKVLTKIEKLNETRTD